MEPLYFATGNQGKLDEARLILERTVVGVEAPEHEIQSLDLEEIAAEKARQAFTQARKPLFVDDVGLYLDAWNGFPGPFVKYLVESAGNEGMLRMLAGEENRAAVARQVIAFCDGSHVHTFVGERKGRIASEIRGANGFGWDAVFIPEGAEKTYAELSIEEKSALSHRRAALERFKEYLDRA